MMKKILSIYILLIVITSAECRKENHSPDFASEVSGKYIGYERRVQGQITSIGDTLRIDFIIARKSESTVDVSIVTHHFVSGNPQILSSNISDIKIDKPNSKAELRRAGLLVAEIEGAILTYYGTVSAPPTAYFP